MRGHARGEDLLADDGVDLVIVSTPPNTPRRLGAAGAARPASHVVVEKPFCLTVDEADRQIAAAAERRPDRSPSTRTAAGTPTTWRSRRRSAAAGSARSSTSRRFVGGYDHPCNFWHSDADISGGAIYDWGSHYLDWVLDLFPQPVEWVSATAHKRVWHDVTNADHTRVLLHFADGVEAEFTHSDLAAALQAEVLRARHRGRAWSATGGRSGSSPLADRDAGRRTGFAAQRRPADLSLFTPDGAGGTSHTRLPVPPPPAQPFHRELADALLSGWPMSVTPEGSRRNIAVMQAATASAADGGRPVPPPA